MDLAVLADIELQGVDGRLHRLGAEWQARPIVLVFSRHFG
jgi:hypothetical protein